MSGVHKKRRSEWFAYRDVVPGEMEWHPMFPGVLESFKYHPIAGDAAHRICLI